MERIQTMSRKGEKGFTLVELAIVMIIIGLLIVGILKGQEMIANAQVSSTITQVKSMDAATSTFRDMFNAVPGDMATATNRLAGCTVAPCANGNGDGRVSVAVGAALATGNEAGNFFLHMLYADLISGIDGTAGATYGQEFPAAPVGGGFTVGHTSTGNGGFPALRPGHYLTINETTLAAGGTEGVLNGTQSARVDRKMDDGIGNTGSVQALGTTCLTAGAYDENVETALCSLAFRVQG